ncbi:acidic mammalian chitinase-like [Tropilaelaps mercedesae]|uniref:Acidic mammalian chitinase-like n=1 Tax=Tropilaelaps mercedesae TaxID=418985 RepID=A0A1V9XH71_9ACAR|nr:acidic mammalian chitinase-like [Tropilaelaps mercedesae]
MKVLLAVAAFAVGAGRALAGKPFICYWESWSRYRPSPYTGSVDKIPTDLCTHVIYTFAGLDSNTWKLKALDEQWDIGAGGFKQLVALKNKNPKLKVSFAVGGWGEGVERYSNMVASSDHRKIFVKSVVDWMKTYDFDGFDVDWEYPADLERGGKRADKAYLILLLKELREALGPKKLLTIAVFSTNEKIELAYDVPNIAKYCDYIHVMTYDLRANWDGVLGNHVALYPGSNDHGKFTQLTVAQGMKNWAAAGAPKDKLIMGIAFYGKSFTLQSSTNNRPGDVSIRAGSPAAVSQEAGTLFYFEICERLKQGWTRVFDGATKVPHAYNGDQWVGYEDGESIRYKTDLINKEGYGGAMTWAIARDDEANVCGGGSYPLSRAIVKGLGGSNGGGNNNDDTNLTTPAPQPTLSTTSSLEPSPRPNPSPVDCSSGQEYIPHSSKCTKYIRCVYGTPFEQTCPSGLVFDSNAKVCNWPFSVNPKLPAGCSDANGQ